MKNKYKLIIALILLSLLGLTYWFIARPYFERIYCHKTILVYSIEQVPRNAGKTKLAIIEERKKIYDVAYDYCLHSQGL